MSITTPLPDDGPASSPSPLHKLIYGFSRAVDHRQPEAVAECFTHDGLFRPGDNEFRGRDAIGAFYQQRLADPRRVTRHLWSNIEVQHLSDTEAQLTAVLATYAIEPSVSLEDVQLRMGDVACLCRREDDGVWRFAEHIYTRAFAASLPLSTPPAPTATKDIKP